MATERLQRSVMRVVWLLFGFFVLVAITLLLPEVLYHPGGRAKARGVKCFSNQKQIAMAITLYTQEHEGMYPRSFADLKMPDKSLHCPGDHKLFRFGESQHISYGLNGHLSGVKATQVHDPSSLVLTADGGNARHLLQSVKDIATDRHHGIYRGYIASFADGHVEIKQLTNAALLRLSPATQPPPTRR